MEVNDYFDTGFYNNRKVLVTGHTGFKGSWMSVVLAKAGAEVIGYSTCSKSETRLFDICGIRDQITHIKGDVRDLDGLIRTLSNHRPEIVIHMAAQPLVREGYSDPVGTYSTNVMGTVNICEAVRRTPSVRSFLNVTTDKVYENKETDRGYTEDDRLDGFDPYSNSKSCSEMVTHSYVRSFFADMDVAVSTARAGNVIGGGDFAKDRIIPDCVRAAINGETIMVRNPYSIRPYQHVLEPVMAYLMIAASQYKNVDFASNYNIGPEYKDCLRTKELVEMFANFWDDGVKWDSTGDGGPHEANLLKLDCTKIKNTFGWQPVWNAERAVEKAVEWYKAYAAGEDTRAVMDKQIKEYTDGRKS